MESALTTLVTKLAEYGPGFLTAGLFGVLYILERKKNDKLSDKLYELGFESLKVAYEHEKVYASMEKTLDTLAKSLSQGGKNG